MSAEFGPGVSFAADPPKVTPPSVRSCGNCHWDQDVLTAATGFDPDSSDQNDAGHPSTYEHFNPWGELQGYFEYQSGVFGTGSTHMKQKSNFAGDCTICHSVDGVTSNFDLSDPENIRACGRCHTHETLHAIHRKDTTGWQAAGWHAGGDFGTKPSVFRAFNADEMCVGCHAEVPAVPTIRKLKPKAVRPGMTLKILGNNFGDVQGGSLLHIGKATYDETSSKIKGWSNTKIKFRVPKFKTKWFRGKDFRRKDVWVTVNNIVSNAKRLKICQACQCDLNKDGICNDVDLDILTVDLQRMDCGDPGVKCKGDIDGNGLCNGVDSDLFMTDYERLDCQQL
jgi:hypothetical protein